MVPSPHRIPPTESRLPHDSRACRHPLAIYAAQRSCITCDRPPSAFRRTTPIWPVRKFIRKLASVYTNHDPQPSNPNQVMVIMFSVELRAVDEPHRHLKSFMEGRECLQFR